MNREHNASDTSAVQDILPDLVRLNIQRQAADHFTFGHIMLLQMLVELFTVHAVLLPSFPWRRKYFCLKKWYSASC
jgi:hypothetical protein